MGRARYKQSSSLRLINGLQHIQTSAYLNNGMVTIDLNKNADESMKRNLQLAFGGDKFAQISKPNSKAKTFQITIPQSQYNSLVSGREQPLQEFFDKFLQHQTKSMKQTLEKTKGFKDCALSNNNSSIICEKPDNMSSLNFYRTKLAFQAYRDTWMTGNTTTKAQLKNMSYGPSFLRQKEQKLGKEISSRRPQGADMFRSGILGIKPTDVLFFNATRFQDQFPKERKEYKKQTPETLISEKVLNAQTPFFLRVLPGLNIIAFAIKVSILIIAYPLSSFINKGYKEAQKQLGSTYVSKAPLKQNTLSKSVILNEMTHAINQDLEPIKQSQICPTFVETIKETHDEFKTRTLTGHYNKNTYDLKSPALKTVNNSNFCAGTTKNIGKDASIITFHGHSRLEAQETVLHELTHSICHRISNLQSFDKNEFNALAKQANAWIKDFCSKNDISFDTSTVKNIDGRIMQGLDYHANEGIEYMANLLPKISQIRSLKPEQFDSAVNRPNNPVNHLCHRFDQLCEQLQSKSVSQTPKR